MGRLAGVGGLSGRLVIVAGLLGRLAGTASLKDRHVAVGGPYGYHVAVGGPYDRLMTTVDLHGCLVTAGGCHMPCVTVDDLYGPPVSGRRQCGRLVRGTGLSLCPASPGGQCVRPVTARAPVTAGCRTRESQAAGRRWPAASSPPSSWPGPRPRPPPPPRPRAPRGCRRVSPPTRRCPGRRWPRSPCTARWRCPPRHPSC